MTVKQLIKTLKQLPPDSEIRVMGKDGEPREPEAILPAQRYIGFLSRVFWVIVA